MTYLKDVVNIIAQAVFAGEVGRGGRGVDITFLRVSLQP